jgi:oxygen-dependent protoporphyrinogen oxidase
VGTGFIVPRVERSLLHAATWVTSKWLGRAPEGHALLRAFLGGGSTEGAKILLMVLIVHLVTRLYDPLLRLTVPEQRFITLTRTSKQLALGELRRGSVFHRATKASVPEHR